MSFVFGFLVGFSVAASLIFVLLLVAASVIRREERGR